MEIAGQAELSRIFVSIPLPFRAFPSPVLHKLFYLVCLLWVAPVSSAFFPWRLRRRFSGGCGGRREKPQKFRFLELIGVRCAHTGLFFPLRGRSVPGSHYRPRAGPLLHPSGRSCRTGQIFKPECGACTDIRRAPIGTGDCRRA